MRARALLFSLSIALAQPALAQDAGLSLRHNREADELIFDIGPLHLEANADHGQVPQPRARAIALPIGGYLHGFTYEMLDAKGNQIPNVMLHHVNIIAPQRRELFSQIMQRVGAAGAETGPVVVPKVLGYPVSKGDSLLFTAMLHNPTNESYHNATLRIRMRYSESTRKLPVFPIQPFYLDVMPPAGGHAYDLPAGRSSKSWEGKPAIDGRILAVGGHMHKYGLLLRLEDVTENKVLWEARPELDDKGNIIGMPKKYFVWRLGIPLKAENTYRLTAFYNNPTGKTIPLGGMGALGGIVVPADGKEWPSVNRKDPEYLYDIKVTYQGAYGHGGHGGGHTGH
jgi:hypothetical protein